MPLKAFPVLLATVAHVETTVEIAALALLVLAVVIVVVRKAVVVVATVPQLLRPPRLQPKHNCSFF